MSPEVEHRLWPLLDAAEHARAERFKFDWLRRRFTVSHAMVRLVLAERVGVEPAALRFEAGPHGKPALVGAGAGAVDFNLSHSADRAVVAVCAAGAVGVDVELVRELSHVEQVADRILSPEELEQFNAAADPHRFVLERWTCKEAVVKQSGDGITRSLRDVDGSVCASLDIGPGFLCALAADAGAAWSHALRQWDPPA